MSSLGAFLAALVLVSPFAFITFRRLWRERRERRRSEVEVAASPPEPDHDLAAVAKRVTALVDDHRSTRPGVPFDLPVPSATIGGREADLAVVAAVIADDLRRRALLVEVVDGVIHVAG